jgi:hypothetical protein
LTKDTKQSFELKILEYIREKGKANLEELDSIGIRRQTLRYNLRKMWNEKTISPYLRVKPQSSKACFEIPKDEEVFFTIVNKYDFPQDVKNLIDEMSVGDIKIAMQKMENFISLCETRSIPGNMSKKLAHLLMSDIKPGFKERISFELAYNRGRAKREGLMSLAHVHIEDILVEFGYERPIVTDPEFLPKTLEDFDDGKED